MPEIGQIVPEFELLDSTETRQRLSDLVGQTSLVLLFYRGDW